MNEPWIERVIRDAQEAGKFDDVAGTGEPIADLDREYEPAWWARRWIAEERRRQATTELVREIDRRLPVILAAGVTANTLTGLESLNTRIRQHNKTSAEADRLPLLDIEALLAERERRHRS